jgi:hypothetical protein
MQKFDTHMERGDQKKLNVVEDKEQYQVECSNRFAALENLYDDVDINRVRKLLENMSKFQPRRA